MSMSIFGGCPESGDTAQMVARLLAGSTPYVSMSSGDHEYGIRLLSGSAFTSFSVGPLPSARCQKRPESLPRFEKKTIRWPLGVQTGYWLLPPKVKRRGETAPVKS